VNPSHSDAVAQRRQAPSVARREVDLCAPVTDIFRRNQVTLLPLIRAVSHKASDGTRVDGKVEMLECSLNIASSDFPERLQDDGWLAALHTGRFVSFACDLGPACDVDETNTSPNGYPRYLPQSKVCSREEYFDRSAENVAFLRSHYGGVLKVENLNYFPTGAYEMVCEPEFIADLTRRLEIELLLDIGHLTVSASNLKVSTNHYLRQLSRACVSEVQVSGSRVVNGTLEDAHEMPAETDWMLVDAVREWPDVRNLTITLEYYRDDARLVNAYTDLSRRFSESCKEEI